MDSYDSIIHSYLKLVIGILIAYTISVHEGGKDIFLWKWKTRWQQIISRTRFSGIVEHLFKLPLYHSTYISFHLHTLSMCRLEIIWMWQYCKEVIFLCWALMLRFVPNRLEFVRDSMPINLWSGKWNPIVFFSGAIVLWCITVKWQKTKIDI